MTIEIVPATIEHAEAMAPRMRHEDSTEVLALGLSAFDALRHSLDGSIVAETALVDGEPAAMWGACAEAIAGNKAFLWMLGTDHVPRNAKALLKVSRFFVAHVHRTYPVLECLVDMRYHKAVKWIMWMGFERVGVAPINGVPFALCQRRA